MGTYYLRIDHGHTADVRLFLNGFLMRIGTTTTQDVITMPVDRFLVPGENILHATVLSGDPNANGSFFIATVRSYDDDKARLAEFDWEKEVGESGSAIDRSVPFHIPDSHPRPVWLDAKPEQIPPQGTPELIAPIRELEGALAAGNATAVASALTLRASEFYRMERFPEASPENARALAASQVQAPFDVIRARDEELLFTPAAGGRAAMVTRTDGSPAINATSSLDRKLTYVASPLLVRHEGRFQIFS